MHEDMEAWGTGMDLQVHPGIIGTRALLEHGWRHCSLQKGPWTEGSDLGSLTGKVPSKGSFETEPFRGTFRWRPEQDL